MELYQWITVGSVAIGFVGTWIVGSFKLGRAVEQIKNDVKNELKGEQDKLLAKIERIEERFEQEQRAQDNNAGEMGHALRRHMESISDKVREVEIWGRDNYVLKENFEKAVDMLRSDVKELGADLKSDMRRLFEKFDHVG